MNSLSLLIQKRIFPAIILFLSMLPVPLLAAQYIEEVSTQEFLFAKGRLRDVSLANQTITIQQKDGPRITVLVNAETEFKGFEKLGDLQGNNVIKIWYRQGQPGNIGLKILKPLELGC